MPDLLKVIFLIQHVDDTKHAILWYYITSDKIFIQSWWSGFLHSFQKWWNSMMSNFDNFPCQLFLYFAKNGVTHTKFKIFFLHTSYYFDEKQIFCLATQPLGEKMREVWWYCRIHGYYGYDRPPLKKGYFHSENPKISTDSDTLYEWQYFESGHEPNFLTFFYDQNWWKVFLTF